MIIEMMENNKRYFDIIGDIHGHSVLLEKLLKKLDYKKQEDFYQHPERTAIFVGDLIDRGPQNFKSLKIIKDMVDQGSAIAIMGNHEYNALCYHTKDKKGNFFRPHSLKNNTQHHAVLKEIKQKGKDLWQSYLEWFRKMPLYLELNGIRVVHACWDPASIHFLKQNDIRDASGRLTDSFILRSCQKGTNEYLTIENLLKGYEIDLPKNHPGIYDRDNILRHQLRLKWWMESLERKNLRTYEQVVRADANVISQIKGLKIPDRYIMEIESYWKEKTFNHRPVFFGHYWYTGKPQILTKTSVCLDYSIAKGGKLVGYRWDGEKVLDSRKLVWI